MASLLVLLPSIPILQYIIILLLIQMPPYFSSNNYYADCTNFYSCGNIKNIGFPFWGGNRPKLCGHPLLNLTCNNDTTYITIKDVQYQVLEANPDNRSLRIARVNYLQDLCPSKILNTSLDPQLFVFGSNYQNLTLFYGCPGSNLLPSITTPDFNCTSGGYVYVQLGSSGPLPLFCKTSAFLPVPPSLSLDFISIQKAFREGFWVRWITGIEECERCKESGGVCGYDWSSSQTTCYSRYQSSDSVPKTWYSSPNAKAPPPAKEQGHPLPGKSNGKAIGIGIGAGVVALIGVLGFVCFMMQRRKKIAAEQSRSKDDFLPPSTRSALNSMTTTDISQTIPSYASSKTDSVPRSFYFGVQVFTYAELEEATDNFHSSRELGEGGFGTVYKGELKDGRVVAVKRHYESSFKRVEQFMNEVEILARLRHKNLVTLYGCTSKHSRDLLLVYEFIPNGTVADHLHGKSSNSTLLPWSVRLNIAIETAEALSYLHASDVIHRDVKSNNILLDDKFRVKVADFGLSRLFPQDVTHVSTAPQGTPGYVDPEYYQCYQLTDKSDVYSFGVVLVELISSLPAVDVNRHRNDVNLANMAINKIQSQALNELVDPYLGSEKDYSIRRKTIAVAELAFRCLQQERDMRPSMDEVLEILRGIKSDEPSAREKEVVDVKTDEIILLKKAASPVSPDSVADHKWQWDMLRRTA